jgi:antitoxin component YwqK of YwqJK toxin-antitoxin module
MGNGRKKEYYPNENIKAIRRYKDGEQHREDGSAIIRYDKKGCITKKEYYLNGKEVKSKDLPYIKRQTDKIKKILEEQNQKKKIKL